MNQSIPDNPQNINIKLFVLDPLSVIIKLAILGNKPVGTKIIIQNNVMYFQEPGPFQSLCRYVYNTNKTDLQYLYNPIELAASHFLSKEYVAKTPRVKTLFAAAQRGLDRLMETYRNSPIIRLCLHYYSVIIANHLSQTYNEAIFRKESPLHDGAVILAKGRIQAASCVLPLDEHHASPSTVYGMRHKAALGMSEQTDALVVLVSEESGQIVLADNGQFSEPLTPNDLMHRIGKTL
ncbi:MAG: hypothetical protein EBX50_10050 [Chitinophagia bacterium]|nr:hypothetical protein [Chitinophagia bacterium]